MSELMKGLPWWAWFAVAAIVAAFIVPLACHLPLRKVLLFGISVQMFTLTLVSLWDKR